MWTKSHWLIQSRTDPQTPGWSRPLDPGGSFQSPAGRHTRMRDMTMSSVISHSLTLQHVLFVCFSLHRKTTQFIQKKYHESVPSSYPYTKTGVKLFPLCTLALNKVHNITHCYLKNKQAYCRYGQKQEQTLTTATASELSIWFGDSVVKYAKLVRT